MSVFLSLHTLNISKPYMQLVDKLAQRLQGFQCQEWASILQIKRSNEQNSNNIKNRMQSIRQSHTVATINTRPRASWGTGVSIWNANQMVWIQFQRFFIKFNTSTRISQARKWIIALGCYFLQAERAESETEPKLKLKLAHIQNIQRGTLSFEWIIWNVQMLFAKCAKKKKNLKKDLSISPSLSRSLFPPSLALSLSLSRL